MRDQGVSTVVGAVLALGLLVSAIALYQQTVVPNQKEDAEADHMDGISRDMARVDSDLLKQLTRVSHAPLSSPVTMGFPTPVYVPEPSGTTSLSFRPGEQDATITSPHLRIVTRDGAPLLSGSGTDGQWEVVQSGETIEGINGVIGLRIKITDANPTTGDRLQITATDADDEYAGDLQVIVDINQPDLDLIVQTREPPSPGTTIFHNHILSIHQQRWDSDYWIDAMLDLYWFDLLLEGASKPATLTFTDLGLDAEYKVSYEKQVSSGLTTVVGAGKDVPGYERSFTSGSLVYEASNEFYPSQGFTIEHGALVRSQTDGAAFLVDPPFTATAGGGFVRLGLDVPALSGEADVVTGDDVATVKTYTTERGTFGATAGQLNLTWETEHPAPWAQFLTDELEDAGLTSADCPPTSPTSACQFEIVTGPDSIKLQVNGPHATDADPSEPERDIFLETQWGSIQAEVST